MLYHATENNSLIYREITCTGNCQNSATESHPSGPILTYKGRLNPKNILIGQRWARTKCMSIWVLLTNRSAEVRSCALPFVKTPWPSHTPRIPFWPKRRFNSQNILIGQRWARTKCMSIWVLLTNRSAEVRSSALLDSFCQNSGAFVLPPGTPGKMRVIIFSIYTAMRAISSTRCDIICQLLVVPCRRKQVAGWTATSRTLLVVSLESRSFARTCINGYRYNE